MPRRKPANSPLPPAPNLGAAARAAEARVRLIRQLIAAERDRLKLLNETMAAHAKAGRRRDAEAYQRNPDAYMARLLGRG